MKESVIRKVFCALNWPPKTGAFQKLITFVVEGLATKAESSTVQELQTKVETLEGTVQELQTKVETLEGTVNTLQETITTLSGKVSTLESNYTSLEGRVTALETPQG